MIKPLNSYIVVEVQDENEEKTAGGIFIPQNTTATSSNLLRDGNVIAINSKCDGISIGDKVLFNKHALKEIPNEKNLKLVREEDIYGII
jgi:chaperonin GroES